MDLVVVDAFTSRPFSGNPAAVALLDEFPDEDRMQAIAREMNLSETAFVVQRDDREYDLRWFTPVTEVNLCGHATLASAHVVGGGPAFHTRSGVLTCTSDGDWIRMNFPALAPRQAQVAPLPPGMQPVWTGHAGDDWLVELGDEGEVVSFDPDLSAIASLGRRGFVVTARSSAGSEVDFVSRVFAPNAGIPEDPVTGSAHCALAPYWAARIGRDELVGYQASRRGGTVRMRLDGDRVELSGQAVTTSTVTLLV